MRNFILFLIILIFISCSKNYNDITYIDIKNEEIEIEMRNIINEAKKTNSTAKLSTLENRAHHLELKISNNLTLSIVNYSKDVTNLDNEKNRQKYTEQYYLFEKLLGEFGKAVQMNEALQKKCSENCLSFKTDSKINSRELENLKNKRESLVMKYNILLSELGNKYLTYDNKKYSLEDIKKINDEKLYTELKNNFYRQNSKEFIPLLKEIIETDKKLAVVRNFESPVDMYYSDYHRGFDYKDSLKMVEITKEYFSPLLKYKIDFDTSCKIEDLTENYPKILSLYNKNMFKVWNIMIKNELYDIKQSNLKQEGFNYVTYFPKDKVPYLLMNSYDRDTLFILSHEFAHFYDNWINKDKFYDYSEDANIPEVAEMYGQMNPVFLMINLEKIYSNSKKAEEVRIQMLYDYVQMMINNAMFEKFYIHLYQSEDIELENITQLFSKINDEFYGEGPKDYSWYAMLNIERPFYDIDYWRGTHIALQLFFMTGENEKDAVNIFEKMIRLDKNLSFDEIIKKTPFKNPLDREETDVLTQKLDKIFLIHKN